MGNSRQADRQRQWRRIFKDGCQLAVVEPQELLENEAGKQLRLSEQLGAAPMRVIAQPQLANLIGGL